MRSKLWMLFSSLPHYNSLFSSIFFFCFKIRCICSLVVKRGESHLRKIGSKVLLRMEERRMKQQSEVTIEVRKEKEGTPFQELSLLKEIIAVAPLTPWRSSFSILFSYSQSKMLLSDRSLRCKKLTFNEKFLITCRM